MSRIDWEKTQAAVGARVDGKPGRETYGRVISKAIGRGYNPDALDEKIDKVAQGVAKWFPIYGADASRERAADVIAQMAHETGGFRQFEENLNYSAQGLANTWPSRYAINPGAKTKVPNAKALALHRRPEAIANATYGLRMGNVDAAKDNDQSPDGWQYRGRGAGLTGKSNYRRIGDELGLPLVTAPDIAAEPSIAALIFLQFVRNAGTLAKIDASDINGARRSINGGLIGLEDVNKIRAAVLATLKP